MSTSIVFDPISKVPGSTSGRVSRDLKLKRKIFDDYTLVEDGSSEAGWRPVKKDSAKTQADFDLEDYLKKYLQKYFKVRDYKIVLWKPDRKHLINDEIDLNEFAIDPGKVSIPLQNCFGLAGVPWYDISEQLDTLRDDQAETVNFKNKLKDRVTEHIRNIWRDYPIEVEFEINNFMLSFYVKDEDRQYQIEKNYAKKRWVPAIYLVPVDYFSRKRNELVL